MSPSEPKRAQNGILRLAKTVKEPERFLIHALKNPGRMGWTQKLKARTSNYGLLKGACESRIHLGVVNTPATVR